MSKVIADMSMSLDGFVADPQDNPQEVFGWFFGGDVETPTAIPGVSFRTSVASAEHLRSALAGVGALIGGRRLYDQTGGWSGTHPMGVPVFIVTHQPPPADTVPVGASPITFVDNVADAITAAQAAAGDKDVAVATPSITRQALALGRLDGLSVSLVPVLLGAGLPWFAELAQYPVRLADPVVRQGERVTHLYYDVLPAVPDDASDLDAGRSA